MFTFKILNPHSPYLWYYLHHLKDTTSIWDTRMQKLKSNKKEQTTIMMVNIFYFFDKYNHDSKHYQSLIRNWHKHLGWNINTLTHKTEDRPKYHKLQHCCKIKGNDLICFIEISNSWWGCQCPPITCFLAASVTSSMENSMSVSQINDIDSCNV